MSTALAAWMLVLQKSSRNEVLSACAKQSL